MNMRVKLIVLMIVIAIIDVGSAHSLLPWVLERMIWTGCMFILGCSTPDKNDKLGVNALGLALETKPNRARR
jgi:hypothetical protein